MAVERASGWMIGAAMGLVLAACNPMGEVSRGGISPFWFDAIAPRAVRVSGGDIVVSGPQGYCIDRSAAAEQNGTAFAMLGSCASLANTRQAGSPRHRAVLTVSISEPSGAQIGPAADQLVAFFSSADGRASLARDGGAASVEVLETELTEAAVLVRARDQSISDEDGLGQTYWRAFFDLKGRIVTATAFDIPGRPLGRLAARNLLMDFVARMRAANQPAEAVSGNSSNT